MRQLPKEDIQSLKIVASWWDEAAFQVTALFAWKQDVKAIVETKKSSAAQIE